MGNKGDVNTPRKIPLGLDWMTFCMADVQVAIGTFAAISLTENQHWKPAHSGHFAIFGVISASLVAWSGVPAGTARCQNDWEKRASRNSPSFAVALNCGMGSSSLNAEVNALERLQIVRGRKSSYCGSK